MLKLSRLCARFDQVVIDGIVNLAPRVTVLIASLYGLFDRVVVDGAVNGVAAVAGFVGTRTRRLQSGGINASLYVIVVAVVGIMVARLL